MCTQSSVLAFAFHFLSALFVVTDELEWSRITIFFIQQCVHRWFVWCRFLLVFVVIRVTLKIVSESDSLVRRGRCTSCVLLRTRPMWMCGNGHLNCPSTCHFVCFSVVFRISSSMIWQNSMALQCWFSQHNESFYCIRQFVRLNWLPLSSQSKISIKRLQVFTFLVHYQLESSRLSICWDY